MTIKIQFNIQFNKSTVCLILRRYVSTQNRAGRSRHRTERDAISIGMAPMGEDARVARRNQSLMTSPAKQASVSVCVQRATPERPAMHTPKEGEMRTWPVSEANGGPHD